jgi:hypothetical protein
VIISPETCAGRQPSAVDDVKGAVTMELSIAEVHGAGRYGFYIQCPFDLSSLDVPTLGPYPDRRTAARASRQIVEAVSGNSE